MGFIEKGIGLSKTIKNATRLKEIVSVFARNGFDELILKSGALSFLPTFVIPKSKRKIVFNDREWAQSFAKSLRLSFEELGPSFIKLGQLLSTRDDIFDDFFIQEMRLLQDKVKGIEFSAAESVIKSSLKGPTQNIFQSINPEAIGNASVGVVYRATLKEGKEVVLKVRRPGIRDLIEQDFSLFLFLIEKMESVSEEIKYLGLSRLVSDFSISINQELDFHLEALNCKRLKENIEKHDKKKCFRLPVIYEEYTSEQMLVMEFLDGTPFNSPEIGPHLDEVQIRLESGLQIFIRNILQDGFFHADLHGGNFLLLEDKTIGILDFGLVGSMGKKARNNLIAILYHLVNYNYESLVHEFLDVAEYEKIPNIDALVKDIKDALSPFVGLSVQNINFTALLSSVIKVLTTHKLYLPRDWYIVFRAMTTMDGVGRSLGFDFDFFGFLEEDLEEIIGTLVNKDELLEEAMWFGRDVMNSLKILPRHLRWFTKNFSARNFTFDLFMTGQEKQFQKLRTGLIFLGLAILTSVLFYLGIDVAQNPIAIKNLPGLTWGLWGSGAAFLTLAFLVLRK